ncbi:MAG: hypothetical protein ACT4P6_20550 [Gemmatimonadaceae bacterium]
MRKRHTIDTMLATALVALLTLMAGGCVGPIPERADIEIRTVTIDSTRWYSTKGGSSLCLFVRSMERELQSCLGRRKANLGRLRELINQPVKAEIGVSNGEIWQLAVRDSMNHVVRTSSGRETSV